jgi:osmotically-inducible protein OsmY
MRLLKVFCVTVLLLLPLAAADPVSDDAIYDRVRIQLANDREIGGRKFDVKVSQGVVEIEGKVVSEKQKERAEKTARKVKGVKKVINRITVSPAA